MREQIGQAAGKIWKTLKSKGEINISSLPKTINEKDIVIYQALGWLARENKIEYHTKGNRMLIGLTDFERHIN